MEWSAWRGVYQNILDEFGYTRADDEAARDELDALLAHHLRVDLDALRALVAKREAIIVGPLVHFEDVRAFAPDTPVFVADSAAHRVVPFRKPTAIVTDLDGDLAVQVMASAMGVPVFLHAHGDNRARLAAHARAFKGPVCGTTQAEPRGAIQNFGGFTDGDRACCIAVALGAPSLRLVGFDFETPAPKPGQDVASKTRKLAWARRIIDTLGVPVR